MSDTEYSIWIEAEIWEEDAWHILDDNTDVIVEFNNGERWVASFFTYKNINTLVEKNMRTGECLNGKYYWSSDMILIDEVSRESIEKVIKHLIEENEFKYIFTKIKKNLKTDGGSPIKSSCLVETEIGNIYGRDAIDIDEVNYNYAKRKITFFGEINSDCCSGIDDELFLRF